jgi:hypothetical protein
VPGEPPEPTLVVPDALVAFPEEPPLPKLCEPPLEPEVLPF